MHSLPEPPALVSALPFRGIFASKAIYGRSDGFMLVFCAQSYCFFPTCATIEYFLKAHRRAIVANLAEANVYYKEEKGCNHDGCNPFAQIRVRIYP